MVVSKFCAPKCASIAFQRNNCSNTAQADLHKFFDVYRNMNGAQDVGTQTPLTQFFADENEAVCHQGLSESKLVVTECDGWTPHDFNDANSSTALIANTENTLHHFDRKSYSLI